MKKNWQWLLLLIPGGLLLWFVWRWYSQTKPGALAFMPGASPAASGSTSASAGGTRVLMPQQSGGQFPFQANLSSGVNFDLTKAISGLFDWMGKTYDAWTGGIQAQTNQALNDQALNPGDSPWAGYDTSAPAPDNSAANNNTLPDYAPSTAFDVPDYTPPSFGGDTGGMADGGGDLYFPSDFGGDGWGGDYYA